jgi:hypothetical protein
MSEPSVRETAARAYTEHLIGWAMADNEWEAARSSTEVAAMGAALAAVAAHDGLADVLGRHQPMRAGDDAGRRWVECSGCDETTTDLDRFTAHLADVVRAWLRGES